MKVKAVGGRVDLSLSEGEVGRLMELLRYVGPYGGTKEQASVRATHRALAKGLDTALAGIRQQKQAKGVGP